MAKKSEPKAEAEQPPNDKAEDDTCFVIMPFGGWKDKYYQGIFRPAIENAGLEPRRADDLYRPGSIMNHIWAYTQEAKVILADLTGKNPNVFYELGLAHAIAKPVILVSESVEDIPFDLRDLRVIGYDKDDPNWGSLLRERITESIKETLEAPKRFVLPTFLKVDETARSEKVSPYEKELLELRQAIKVLFRRFDTAVRPLAERVAEEEKYAQLIREGKDPVYARQIIALDKALEDFGREELTL